MNVKLLSCTPDALTLLLRTKNTRLKFEEDPGDWSDEKRAEHLAYMRDTIRSSWEFVSYTFEISEVTRAFTHQLVRTRSGSYAQESQRTVDARSNGFSRMVAPEGEEHMTEQLLASVFNVACQESFRVYENMLDAGMAAQDARGVLPTATFTSIIAQFNLRTLSEMAKVRLCTRTQGEYSNVFKKMREAVLVVHPWAEDFIQVHCVAVGTCAFPRYGKTSCQFYDQRMDLDYLREETKKKYWSQEIKVAVPVAKDGKTM